MKIVDITQFEKLKINSINLNDFDNIKIHIYHPKTKDELIQIINERIKNEGYNCDLNDIDTSEITDMSKLFSNKKFYGDVSKWNVSNVIDMCDMFWGCTFFNCDLSNWDVSKVINMESIFGLCNNFNSDISNWNISNVNNMNCMFYECYKFNQDISHWDVSNVKYMNGVFYGCRYFNCNLNDWNISKVEDMRHMFQNTNTFNQPLDKWFDKLKNVNQMNEMFKNAKKFNQDLSKWDFRDISMFNADTTDMFSKCQIEWNNLPKGIVKYN